MGLETSYGITAEDGTTLLTAEDGTTYILQDPGNLTAEDGTTLLTAEDGTTNLVNFALTNTLTADTATFSVGDVAITFTLGIVNGILAEDGVTYLTAEDGTTWLTGNAVATDYTLTTTTGSFILTGNDAAIGRTIRRVVLPENYTLSGFETGVLADYKMTAVTATFGLLGRPITMNYSGANRTMLMEQGAYTLTGYDAGIQKLGTVSLAKGTFTLTGNAIAFRAGHRLACDTGSFTLTGNDLRMRDPHLECSPATFELTGSSMAFLLTRVVTKTGGDDAPLPWEENYRQKRWDAERADRERLKAQLEGRDPDTETAGSAPAVEDEPAADRPVPSPPAPRPARPPLDINLEAFQAELAQRLAERQAALIAQRNAVALNLILF